MLLNLTTTAMRTVSRAVKLTRRQKVPVQIIPVQIITSHFLTDGVLFVLNTDLAYVSILIMSILRGTVEEL